MLELTDKRLVSILWMLKNKGKKWSIFELRKGAVAMFGKDDAVYVKNTKFPIMDLGLTYGPTHTFVKELENSGFISKDTKTNEYGVSKAKDLVKFISLAKPFSGLKTINYYSGEDFSSILKIVNASKLPYAFTVFAGSELYRPYVKTNQVHFYIRHGDEKKWADYLLAKKCLKADKANANIFIIPASHDVFLSKAVRVKGFSVVPTPILLSDLMGFGGLGEEQANYLMEEWLNDTL